MLMMCAAPHVGLHVYCPILMKTGMSSNLIILSTNKFCENWFRGS
jgi:hypothetical protein